MKYMVLSQVAVCIATFVINGWLISERPNRAATFVRRASQTCAIFAAAYFAFVLFAS